MPGSLKEILIFYTFIRQSIKTMKYKEVFTDKQ